MLLSARILQSVSGVNAFDYANQMDMTEGDTPTVYLQLVDMSKDRPDQGFMPGGRRYMPASGAVLQVTLAHIDSARQVTRLAMQPFASDPSIWAVDLLPTDKLRGTVNLKLMLNESGRVTQGQLQGALRVASLNGMTRL